MIYYSFIKVVLWYEKNIVRVALMIGYKNEVILIPSKKLEGCTIFSNGRLLV